MHMYRHSIRPSRRKGVFSAILCLLSLALVLSALTACSDQQLIEGDETTRRTETTGQLTVEVTGATIRPPETTEPGISIDPGTIFADAEHVLYAEILNTGKSDCILIRADDQVILIDTGDDDDRDLICGKLADYGISTVDYLIITHFDNDHIGSAPAVLERFTVREVFLPDYVRDSRRFRAMTRALEAVADRTTVHRLTEDVHLPIANGSLWINPTSLYPAGSVVGSDANKGGPDANGIEENNFSLITSLTFGDVNLLFTGDAEKARMEEFGRLLPADARYQFLKTPHHGDYDKALGQVMSTIRPDYCVICTDDVAHVEASLVTKMRSLAAGAYYTCNGTVLFATDGTRTVISQS